MAEGKKKTAKTGNSGKIVSQSGERRPVDIKKK